MKKDSLSSITLTMQLLNREKEKQQAVEKEEAAEEAAKSRCRTCFKEIAPKRLCGGHAGGGGGGGGAASATASGDKASPGAAPGGSGSASESGGETTGEYIVHNDAVEADFDPDIISELLDKGLLLVNSDRASLTLSIELLCEPATLTPKESAEFKKYIEAIIKEFNQFQEQHHHAGDIDMIQAENGSIRALRIRMPDPVLYDKFIQQLANNLVPMLPKREVLSVAEEIAPEQEEQEIFNPSPFNMKPR